MGIDDVRSAYDLLAEREWNRLESGAQHRLEYIVTTHALRRHLPKPSPVVRILDAGGGPGRYTIALAEQGYRVTLFDLSSQLLELARTRIADRPDRVRDHIDDVLQGSITDLSRFPDASFDATICLGGPLSHLVQRDDRRRAIAELHRVTKVGGLLYVSVLGRIGQYRAAVQWPDWFSTVFPEIAETGVSVITPARAPCYFYLPEELESEMLDAGLAVERIYGCQGIGAHLDEANLLALMDDPKRWPVWEQKLLDTSDHPAVVGVSNHILVVSRKRHGPSGP